MLECPFRFLLTFVIMLDGNSFISKEREDVHFIWVDKRYLLRDFRDKFGL